MVNVWLSIVTVAVTVTTDGETVFAFVVVTEGGADNDDVAESPVAFAAAWNAAN